MEFSTTQWPGFRKSRSLFAPPDAVSARSSPWRCRQLSSSGRIDPPFSIAARIRGDDPLLTGFVTRVEPILETGPWRPFGVEDLKATRPASVISCACCAGVTPGRGTGAAAGIERDHNTPAQRRLTRIARFGTFQPARAGLCWGVFTGNRPGGDQS